MHRRMLTFRMIGQTCDPAKSFRLRKSDAMTRHAGGAKAEGCHPAACDGSIRAIAHGTPSHRADTARLGHRASLAPARSSDVPRPGSRNETTTPGTIRHPNLGSDPVSCETRLNRTAHFTAPRQLGAHRGQLRWIGSMVRAAFGSFRRADATAAGGVRGVPGTVPGRNRGYHRRLRCVIRFWPL